MEASFSPDSQFVLSGSSDGRIHVWNVEKGNKVAVLSSDHIDTVQCIQFNPKNMMFASTCQHMVNLFKCVKFRFLILHVFYLRFSGCLIWKKFKKKEQTIKYTCFINKIKISVFMLFFCNIGVLK